MRDFVNHVHLVGIGGIGMSGIAEVLLHQGFEISGSDLQAGIITDRLETAGATIRIGHAAENINGADVVVTSSAVSSDNPEVREARVRNIPLVQRAEMLGELMRFKQGIAIAGTHGKTTTTSLVASVLATAGMDPTFIVGGVVNSVRSNARLGDGDHLVAEADESDASFLHLHPQMAVVTNIDADHMETYDGNFDRLVETYEAFLRNLPFYGLAFLCNEDPVLSRLADRIHTPVIRYGLAEPAEVFARGISQSGRTSTFEVVAFGESLDTFELALPGQHNVLNALAAIAIALKLGIDAAHIKTALKQFEGIGRRFESLGRIKIPDGEFELVDDYAHHPSELRATLQAARDCWPDRRLVPVFQPHRYSRTRDLFDDFAQLLSEVDHLVVTEVYAAGESPLPASDGRSLCRAIRRRGKDPIFVEGLDTLSATLQNLVQPDDVVLTLGAGDIGRFARNLSVSGVLT